MSKGTITEIETRVELAKQAILAGVDDIAIRQDMARRWGISDRQARRYLSDAREQLDSVLELNRLALLAEHLAVRRDLRRRARENRDLRVELAVIQDEAKLLGLYAPDEVKQTVSGNVATSNIVVYIPDNSRGDRERIGAATGVVTGVTTPAIAAKGGGG